MHKLSLLAVFYLLSVATASPQNAKTERVKVVDIHVGGDDKKEGTFVYKPPAGYAIKDIQLHEMTKGGDAQYNVVSKTPEQVQVHWRVASKTVRGPFRTLINTITAFLTLEMTATLEKMPSPQSTPPNTTVKEEPRVVDSQEVGLGTALRILLYNATIPKLLGYGGTLLAAIWAVWLSLPDSRKEAVIDRTLQKIRRKRARQVTKKELATALKQKPIETPESSPIPKSDVG